MGCRTANGWDINCDDPKLGQLKDGRGNISPVTIIMPTLAMQVKEKVLTDQNKDAEKNIDWQEGTVEKKSTDAFMKLLDKKINEARDMLLERFDWQCS
jgi:ribonucleoside-triphosphate reductase